MACSLLFVSHRESDKIVSRSEFVRPLAREKNIRVCRHVAVAFYNRRMEVFMQLKVEVVVSEQTGRPIARIPSKSIWEFVEFLSIQRIRVSYTYDQNDFIVSFLNFDPERAQRIVNEWANSQFAPSAG
jgi:hypothetical protein